MVIIKYTTKTQPTPVKEMFISPQHYAKWRSHMGSKLTSIKPIKGGR